MQILRCIRNALQLRYPDGPLFDLELLYHNLFHVYWSDSIPNNALSTPERQALKQKHNMHRVGPVPNEPIGSNAL